MNKHWRWLAVSAGSGCLLALACSGGGSERDPGGTANGSGGPATNTVGSTTGAGAATATGTSGGTTAGASVTSNGSTNTNTTATSTASSAGGAATSMGGAASTIDVGTTVGAGAATGAGGSNTVGGVGGSATTGGCASLPICEDFEGGTPGAEASSSDFTVRTEGSGSVVFDSDAHGGSVSVLAQGQMAYLVNSTVPMAATGAIYVRAYMKLGEAVSMNHVGYITLSGGVNMEQSEMRFGGQNGQLHFNESTGDGLAPDPFEYPECTECITMTPGQWTCVEVMFDYQNQIATAWVGDESFTADEATDFHSGTVTWPTTPSEIKVGFRAWGGENTVWYDDVAVAYQRIGCQ